MRKLSGVVLLILGVAGLFAAAMIDVSRILDLVMWIAAFGIIGMGTHVLRQEYQ